MARTCGKCGDDMYQRPAGRWVCRECNREYAREAARLARRKAGTPERPSFDSDEGRSAHKKAKDATYRAENRDKVRTKGELYRAANRQRLAAYDRVRSAEKAEYKRARAKAWREANPERAKAMVRECYKAKRDEYREKQAAWHRANIDRRRAHHRNRHDRKRRGAKGKLSAGIVSKLLAAQRGRCVVCRASLKKTTYHIDHIVPLVRGGEHKDANVQLLCPPCNLSKGARDPIDFMQSRGFLI